MSAVKTPDAKCGTCRFFRARNEEEGKLGAYAKDESQCGVGEWVFQGKRKIGCHGGAVRGWCEQAGCLGNGMPPSQVPSTYWCSLYKPSRWAMGILNNARAQGSANRAYAGSDMGEGTKWIGFGLSAIALLYVASKMPPLPDMD